MEIIDWILGRVIWEGVVGNAPTDPSRIQVDRDDDESVLYAAAIFDRHGHWDEAIGLYEYAKQRWPEKHAIYAENCITEVRSKMELGPAPAPPQECANCGETFQDATACPMCGEAVVQEL